MPLPLTPGDPPSLGEFRLAGRLGEGGQGVVYLAHDPSGRQVAVKLLSRVDPESRARLERELTALSSVASFCTARLLKADVTGRRPYVVSEYVEGPALDRRVAERGPLRDGDLERLAVGTATALAAVHAAGVVHRDFKPANVLLGPDGPRVVDFGIARAEGASTLTSGLIGTPAYLSPEQIAGTPATQASDVFAWASTVLFAATGAPPFGADTVAAVLNRIINHQPDLSVLPPRLRGLVGACLSKAPAARPTARELMVGLVDPSGGTPGTGPLPRDVAEQGARIAAGATEPSRRSAPAARRRGPLLAGVSVAAALLVAGGTAVWLTGLPETSAERPASTAEPSQPGTGVPSEPATGPAEIPDAVEGVWGGFITPNIALGLQEHDVQVTLESGETTGKWAEADTGCVGKLTALGSGRNTVTMSLTDAGQCVPGTLTLTRKGDRLGYHWTDGIGFGSTYTGWLTRR
ncbi:serine/threonine protein kinase [Spongiactinospora rosea]|uniref:non-specific serine/threonine protein kinase n=1 Tax=Spongiactinospora rosea TaxID=2248750 RepID=A0A366LR05_9ACTN|nr:serine/threonine-protein kinase [Spongiactinospora rosea]RBQ16050.1 serine/threonine protein kinase [Spongiactinospora rosea]